MAPKAVSIEYNNGSPTFKPSGPYLEKYTDTITLSITTSGSGGDVAFPDGSYIAELQFYNSVDKKPENEVGKWSYYMTIESNGTDIFGISTRPREVTVADMESRHPEDRYWFSAVIRGSAARFWVADPEIVNEGGP